MRLEVKDLSFSYGSREVLNNVSFEAREGELLSVLGPNGVGKSTLFRCILGTLRNYSGSITIGGDETRSLNQRELARRVAYIPQIHKPTFGYSVLDTVLMGLTHQLALFSMPRAEHMEAAREALRQIGIDEMESRDFSRLSGGEQQLVLIARAIAQKASVLVMDEPTSSLDYGNQHRVLRLIRELADEGYTVLLSIHNPQHALSYSQRILALKDGRVAALGGAVEVLSPSLMRELYGIAVSFAETPAGRVIIPEKEAVSQ